MRRSANFTKLADAKIWFDHHPDIHPEDAYGAILAWYRRTSRDRRKPPHVLLEKLLIASAINDKDIKQISPPVWDHKGKILSVPSDGFERRRKRAQKDGRASIWDKIDIFIMRNWRVMRPLGDLHFGSNVPGLIEWPPRAVTALIRSLPIGEKMCAEGRRIENDETWYVKKRNRLGLHGQRRYRVHDFLLNKDGFARIDID